MTALSISEKYPDSWRVDHPDFGDVVKTTFTKGVIIDFQKVSNDPFQVQSLVKVQVKGVSTGDYIPIYFNPKQGYWYNKGSGFDKAWMSFRCGDEVVVMLKENVPVAVMGFVDGVPRIGENLIKVKTLPPSSGWFYDAILIFQCNPPWVYFIGGPSSSTSLHYPPKSLSEVGPDGADLKLVAPPILDRVVQGTVSPTRYGGSLRDRFFVIGPILYIISQWHNANTYNLTVRAALYTPSLLATLSNYQMLTPDQVSTIGPSEFNGTPYPNTYLQNTLTWVIFQVVSNNMPGNDPPYSNTWVQWTLNNMTVRPHTKTEMQAAGLWPAGAS